MHHFKHGYKKNYFKRYIYMLTWMIAIAVISHDGKTTLILEFPGCLIDWVYFKMLLAG